MNLDHVIVGSTFEPLLKSYMENKKVLLTKFEAPFFVERFEKPIELEGQTFLSISEAWSFLRFILSMRGLVLNPREPYSVRIEDRTISFGRNSVNFDNCHLFPDPKIKVDLPVKKIANENVYKVMDVMRLTHCNVEGMQSMKIPETYIDEVRFYGKKKIVCISYLSKDQLNSFDFSDTISKMYVEKALLNERDLKRPLISPTRGPRKPKPIVLERVVVDCQETVFRSTKKIKYYEHKDRVNIIKAYRRNRTGSSS